MVDVIFDQDILFLWLVCDKADFSYPNTINTRGDISGARGDILILPSDCVASKRMQE